MRKEYALLGRTGLRVSPLCLGAMTFGTEWGWGSPAETARRILDMYLDAGGNFVDTADLYTNGKSEELLGEFLRGRRDQVVLATKFTFNARPGDPNAGGNGRKNILQAVEGSLRRLKTDYIDLYWLHAWDMVTPVEEVVAAVDLLARQGKVRGFGLSNTPAWYAARAHTLAELRGMEKVCALQFEYSLVERRIEHEFVPMALELGMGILPWSPLASGFLTGRYRRGADGKGEGEGRLARMKDAKNPAFQKFSERNWRILDALLEVSKEAGRPPAQVALNWASLRPGVCSTIIGASKPEQLEQNLAALDFELPAALAARLEEASRPERVYPYFFFDETLQGMIAGGVPVRREWPWYRPG
ncbi:MAG: aldo/keto reductase [Elusimicrobia bacterium]|nr:aldo/keto reductase [Elusimicrobiota bacterium]